jgi:D-proline reductase (dithiol) PrdB
MDYIRYIEKTHEYYRSLGYDKTYNYAYNEDIPFVPLNKPLSECRVALVTTASFLLLDEEGLPLEEPRMIGTNEMEVFTAPSDWPAERILSTSEDHDRYQTDMTDVNAYFPITRMQELLKEGVFGSLSRNYYRTLPNYSHRKTTEVDGPEILRQCREDNVDVALLTPVWPICHQTVSLVARVLEAGGIPTVTYTNARDIAASAGNPRQIFLNYPLGNPAGRPNDPENQRMVLRAGLKLLEGAEGPGIIIDLPYMWSDSPEWMEKFMTNEQPFISEDAEARRQELLQKAREQKARQIH